MIFISVLLGRVCLLFASAALASLTCDTVWMPIVVTSLLNIANCQLAPLKHTQDKKKNFTQLSFLKRSQDCCRHFLP
jgi:hypothetical protein